MSLPPPSDEEVTLAETAAVAGCFGLLSLTLVLVVLRQFVFHSWSWWWCLAPLAVSLIASALVLGLGAVFAGRKGKHGRR